MMAVANGARCVRSSEAREAPMRAGIAARHDAKLRLNRRGRVFVAFLAGVLAWVGFAVLSADHAQSADGPMPVSSYTVRPGDTMWSFAASITPLGGDVSETVSELIELNGLDGAALEVGQRIIVPQE